MTRAVATERGVIAFAERLLALLYVAQSLENRIYRIDPLVPPEG